MPTIREQLDAYAKSFPNDLIVKVLLDLYTELDKVNKPDG